MNAQPNSENLVSCYRSHKVEWEPLVYSMVHEDGGEDKRHKVMSVHGYAYVGDTTSNVCFHCHPYKQRAKVAGLNGAGL